MANTLVRWFDAASIEQCEWPDSHESKFVRDYWVPMMKADVTPFIANIHTHACLLQVDEQLLPITINERNYDDSYVCSPFSHFVSYAIFELDQLKMPWLEKLLAVILSWAGLLLRWGKINRVVHVNNWLLSTNLYPPLTPQQTKAIVSEIKRRYPTHSIVFRSLNPTTCQPLMDELKECGGRFVGSRQVYIFPGKTPEGLNHRQRRDIQKDRALLQKHGYEAVSQDLLSDKELQRCLELYNALYLEKYFALNPQFTEDWMRLVVREECLKIIAIKKDGRIDGVLGYFKIDDIMTTPLFGYDTTLPQSLGLYRMLSVLTLDDAFANDLLPHASSGVAGFKRNRGYRPAIEYSAVLMSHLPFRQRSVWWLLILLTQWIGVPLMKRLKL